MKIKKLLTTVFLFAILLISAACGTLETPENEVASEGEEVEADDNNASEKESGDTVNLRLGHVFAEDDLIHENTVLMADLAEEYSNGELTIDVFSNSQLGGERELVEGVQMGSIDIGLAANSAVVNFIPSVIYWDLPYLIEDNEHMDNVLESEVMATLDEQLSNHGFKNLALQHGGFRQITNSIRPIESLEDLNGINIRLLESEVMIDTFEAISGTRTSNMAFAELYSGLQQGVVDAQENPLNLIYSMRFFEVQDYLSLTNHFFTPRYYLMNSDSFDQLSEENQEALLKASEEAMSVHKEALIEEEEEILTLLKDEGMEVNEVDDEFVNEFRTLMEEEVYVDYYEDIGEGSSEEGEKLIEQIKNLKD